MRLIDADDLKEDVAIATGLAIAETDNEYFTVTAAKILSVFLKAIDKQPTIEENEK